MMTNMAALVKSTMAAAAATAGGHIQQSTKKGSGQGCRGGCGCSGKDSDDNGGGNDGNNGGGGGGESDCDDNRCHHMVAMVKVRPCWPLAQ